MPKKGLPSCECGWCKWWLVKECAKSGLIMCAHCFRVVRTRSRWRHNLIRKHAAAEKAKEES